MTHRERGAYLSLDYDETLTIICLNDVVSIQDKATIRVRGILSSVVVLHILDYKLHVFIGL